MPTVSQAFPVARKSHRCDYCGGKIEPGTRYRRWTGTSDVWFGLATEKRCEPCVTKFGGHFPPVEKGEQHG